MYRLTFFLGVKRLMRDQLLALRGFFLRCYFSLFLLAFAFSNLRYVFFNSGLFGHGIALPGHDIVQSAHSGFLLL